MKHPLPLLVLVPLLAVACTTYQSEHYLGREDVEIARIARADGSTESYVLETGGSEATLRLVTEATRERAFLGLRVQELDKARAERRGVAPYSGLLVTGTFPRSAAEQAGLLGGDVLLRIGDAPTVYADQLPKLERSLQPGQAVEAAVLRGTQELTVRIEPAALRERMREPETIQLERPRTADRPYAGVVLRGIPDEWRDRIFGDDRNGVVLAGVSVGSPAWVAGFRGGDLVEAVDGRPTPDVHELARTIAALGPTEATITLRVRRGDRAFEAPIELDDYTATSEVWVPLVVRVRDGVAEDRWSVGPFGLLMNNRNEYVADASTRDVQTRNVFSALLGLFRYESDPREDELRLLWFIRISL